jgi:hypothetical protein
MSEIRGTCKIQKYKECMSRYITPAIMGNGKHSYPIRKREVTWFEEQNVDHWLPKVGICNLSPQLRNIADNQIGCGLKSYRTAIADLQNLTSAIPQLSAVSCQFCYFLVPFPQLRMVFKISKKIFRTVCFSGNQKFALKGQ